MGRGLERIVMLMKSLSGERADPALQSKRFELSTNKSVCLDSVQISAASRRQTERELLRLPPQPAWKSLRPTRPHRLHSSGTVMTPPVPVIGPWLAATPTRFAATPKKSSPLDWSPCNRVTRSGFVIVLEMCQASVRISLTRVNCYTQNGKHLLRYPKIGSIFLFFLLFF